MMEGHQIELDIWDNTGMNDYERLRRLSYDNVHVVLICFSISDPDSFENVEHMVSRCVTEKKFITVFDTYEVEH